MLKETLSLSLQYALGIFSRLVSCLKTLFLVVLLPRNFFSCSHMHLSPVTSGFESQLESLSLYPVLRGIHPCFLLELACFRCHI